MIIKQLKHSIIIHAFAALHIVMTYMSLRSGIIDSRLLTPLTLLMVTLICMADNIRFSISTILMIVSNLIGYFIGMSMMRDVAHLFHLNPVATQMISSGLTTEIIGWSIVIFLNITHSHFRRTTNDQRAGRYFLSLIFVMLFIYIIRLSFNLLSNHDLFRNHIAYGYIKRYFDNSLLAAIMLIASISLVRFICHKNYQNRITMILITGIAVTALAALSALACQFSYSMEHDAAFPDLMDYLRYFTIGLLLLYSAIILFYLIISSIDSTQRARKAEYQYISLRNQLNPHFLINSLNVLDGLIMTDRKEESDLYLHKLSDILQYRMMTEDTPLITLEKEILNVTNYIDLLNIRFGSSLIVKTDIKKSDLQRLVVPCTIQLLVENAVKHNALMENRPLHIDIHSDTIDITVSNNLIPRFSKSKSTGLGLHYIKEQYKMHSDRDIRILSTKESFTVKIPIL
ncbi:MAG: histidine kinase [Bacteroides sp.]|nr:histidine kinase [Bacteroides sp.]